MPTKIAIVADSHFDEHSRLEECRRLHAWMAADMRERGVELVLHAGDVYERKSTPVERTAVADWLRSLTDFAPVVICRGNHDAPRDLEILERIRGRHEVTTFETPQSFSLPVAHSAMYVQILGLPWPTKAAITRGLDVDARDALLAVLRGLNDSVAPVPGVPRIFLGHVMVRGSLTSTGQPLVGCDYELGLEDLALVQADMYALGHIHLHQRWEIAGAPVFFPGSPRRTNFGELEAKGYSVATFSDAGILESVEFVEVPATPMVHIDIGWDGPAGTWSQPMQLALGAVRLEGAEVRLRYRVDHEHREAARAAAAETAELMKSEGGALTVKLEEVARVRSQARAPEVARALSIGEKLRNYWSAKQRAPSRGDAMLTKLGELEKEDAA